MKKNLLWMMATILFCGVMSLASNHLIIHHIKNKQQ